MKILAIDTSTNVLSCALSEDERILALRYLDAQKTHSATLMPMIDGVLKDGDTDLGEIDYFACTVGPGSFTGIRIGVSTIKGFLDVTFKPCVSIDTLAALSYNGLAFNGIICPMIDARHSNVYSALFECRGGNIKRLKETEAKDLGELIKELTGEVLFIGDGAQNYRDMITDQLGQRAHFVRGIDNFITGSSLILAAIDKIKAGDTVISETLTPEYFRKSGAERLKSDG